jgi:DNA-binding PadR family transcriptional regulator
MTEDLKKLLEWYCTKIMVPIPVDVASIKKMLDRMQKTGIITEDEKRKMEGK